MMPNNQNMNNGCCGCGRTCPCQVNPIVLPERVCTVNRCYQYEQPIVVPTHTRIVNHYYPTPFLLSLFRHSTLPAKLAAIFLIVDNKEISPSNA